MKIAGRRTLGGRMRALLFCSGHFFTSSLEGLTKDTQPRIVAFVPSEWSPGLDESRWTWLEDHFLNL